MNVVAQKAAAAAAAAESGDDATIDVPVVPAIVKVETDGELAAVGARAASGRARVATVTRRRVTPHPPVLMGHPMPSSSGARAARGVAEPRGRYPHVLANGFVLLRSVSYYCHVVMERPAARHVGRVARLDKSITTRFPHVSLEAATTRLA